MGHAQCKDQIILDNESGSISPELCLPGKSLLRKALATNYRLTVFQQFSSWLVWYSAVSVDSCSE